MHELAIDAAKEAVLQQKNHSKSADNLSSVYWCNTAAGGDKSTIPVVLVHHEAPRRAEKMRQHCETDMICAAAADVQ